LTFGATSVFCISSCSLSSIFHILLSLKADANVIAFFLNLQTFLKFFIFFCSKLPPLFSILFSSKAAAKINHLFLILQIFFNLFLELFLKNIS